MTNIEKKAFVKESGRQAESAQVGVNLGFDVLSDGLNRDTKRVKQAFGVAAMAVMPIAGITIQSEKPVIGYDINSGFLKYAIVTADLSPSDLGTMSPQSEKTNQQDDYAKAAERFIANQIGTGGEISAKDLERSNMTNQYVAVGRFVEKLTEGDKPLFKWTGEFGDGGLALNPMKDSEGKVHLTLFVTDKENKYFHHVLIPNPNGRYSDGEYDITDINVAGFEKGQLPFIALDANPGKYSLTLEKSPDTYVETFRRQQFKNGQVVTDEYLDLASLLPKWVSNDTRIARVYEEKSVIGKTELKSNKGNVGFELGKGIPYKDISIRDEIEPEISEFVVDFHYELYRKLVDSNINRDQFTKLLEEGKITYPVKVVSQKKDNKGKIVDDYSAGLKEVKYNPKNGVNIIFTRDVSNVYYRMGGKVGFTFRLDNSGALQMTIADSTTRFSVIDQPYEPNAAWATPAEESALYMTQRIVSAADVIAFNTDPARFSGGSGAWVLELDKHKEVYGALMVKLKSMTGGRLKAPDGDKEVEAEYPHFFNLK